MQIELGKNVYENFRFHLKIAFEILMHSVVETKMLKVMSIEWWIISLSTVDGHKLLSDDTRDRIEW